MSPSRRRGFRFEPLVSIPEWTHSDGNTLGMGQDAPASVLGFWLIVTLVALLLMIPVAIVGLGAMRRSLERFSSSRTPVDRRTRKGGWTLSASKIETPSAADLESQHQSGTDGDAGGDNEKKDGRNE